MGVLGSVAQHVRRAAVVCLLALALPCGAGLQAQAQERPVEAFASLPSVQTIEISPTGEYLAVVQDFENRSIATIQSTVTGETTAAFEPSEGVIRDIFWVTPERALISVTFNNFVNAYRRELQISRLISVTADGGDVAPLMQRVVGPGFSDEGVPQNQSLLSRTVTDGDHVLVSAWTGLSTDIFQIDLNTGNARPVERGVGFNTRPSEKGRTIDWMVSRDHKSRVRWTLNDQRDPAVIQVDASRLDGTWQDIETYRAEASARYRIAGFAEKPETLYVVADRAGETSAIFEYDLAANGLGPLVYAHSHKSVTRAIIDERSGPLLAAAFLEYEPEIEAIDPERQRLQTLIDNTFAKTSVNRIISSTDDGRTHIVQTSGPSTPTVFYMVNTDQQRASALGSAYPDLQNIDLGAVRALTYRARDGLNIRAYLTIPAGLEDAQNLPMVVLPHGGPHLRDTMEFNYQAQFLANRGFAVFQPNFRGSSGYSQAFRAAGYGEWGGKMQDDITDGVEFLIREGIADPDRICIMGGSYGGYAALMGGVKTPGLYRCIISINGVTDLGMLRAQSRQSTAGVFHDISLADVWDNAELRRSRSPSENAQAFQVPVLLIHGQDDLVVEYAQARRMARALRRADKDVTFVTLDGEDHFLSRGETRIAALRAADRFLAEHLR